MTRIDEASIAEGILAAPGWARLGITEPKAELRIEAATELARAILARLRVEDAPTTSRSNKPPIALTAAKTP